MDSALILTLVKDRLGISTTVRDIYITARVNGAITEIANMGLVLDGTNPSHSLLLVDYVTWQYQSRDSNAGMPRHLQFRLHSLIVKQAGGGTV